MAGPDDRARALLGGREIEVGHDDLAACRRQSMCDGAAEPTRAAGDERAV